IDNDISCSDYTIGFDTALNTAVEMIDRLRDTMQSHDRCSVVEVMGRHAGHLAMNVGLATGATYILVPEETYNIEKIVEKIKIAQSHGKHHFIIVVAEGVEGKEELAKLIEEKTGIETKRTVLGHVQRGGNPTARDRILASEMGYGAVQLLSRGIGNRVICFKNNDIIDMDIFAALAMTKTIDRERYKISGAVSI
ncbi:MAG: 6-phosphofructokinase, partial [Clostridia bacterium]|nr:6-phosphofructokinase [Clostridia bacterium]